jgi:YVTN family beta-propeller protein
LGAEGLALSSDGTEVWVVNRQAGTISIINTGTLKVSATIPARIGAGRAEFSAAGRVLVPNGAAASAVEKYLTVYDSLTRRLVVERGMSEGPGAGAFSIFVTGEQAFVADRAARSIAIYDLTDLSETFVIATDRPDPDGIAYSPLRLAVMNSN